jgi:[protein-PII] uridylyltransferase
MDSKSLEHLKERRNDLDRCFMRRRDPRGGETYAQILDDYLRERFSVSLAGFKLDLITNPYAIIAMGSYGRKEVFPRPEVSILFIFKDKIPDGAAELIRDIVYPLWDLGCIVNHSTKTLKDAVAGAAGDYGTLCSLLDSRFICGVSPLYSRLMTSIREKIIYRKKKDILSFLYERDGLRHKKYDGGEYLLEPDLFHAPGGLADANSVFLATRVSGGGELTAGLETTGILSEKEIDVFKAARDFLRDLIVYLQLTGETNKGQLSLPLQASAAKFFNYRSNGPDSAADAFLSDLEMHRETVRLTWKRFYGRLMPEKTTVSPSPESEEKTQVKWVVVSRGMVKVTSLSKLRKHPELVFSILSESEASGFPVSPETLRMISEFGEDAPKGFFDDPAAMALFENSLFNLNVKRATLEIHAETGLLTSFVPELKSLSNKRVFSYQPRYSLLKHSLLTLAGFRELAAENLGENGENLSRESLSAGMWASLLHVLAETARPPGKHEETVRSVLLRFGKTNLFVKKVLGLLDLNRTLFGLVHGGDPWDEEAFQPLLPGLNSPADLLLLHLFCLSDLRARASRCFTDFKEADLRHAVIVCAGLKGWRIPLFFSKSDSVFNVKERTKERTSGKPSVTMTKAENMRVLSLGFSEETDPVLPAVRALEFSGIDLYDLRLFPADNGWKDILVRVKAPKDSMFETKKWTGFADVLKEMVEGGDCQDGECNPEDFPVTGDSPVKKDGDDTRVQVFPKGESKKTTIVMHGARSTGSLSRIVKGLGGKGLSPFYIKKTCCDRDFCLVIHADSEQAPDENAVKEVVYEACIP